LEIRFPFVLKIINPLWSRGRSLPVTRIPNIHLNLKAKKEIKGAIASLSRQYTRIP
jgi:hypothetical protein